MNPSAPGFLDGGGEMGAAMRAHDWSRSPLGDPASWPASLAAIVNMALSSKFPMLIVWGAEFAVLYNDSYISVLGDRHGSALGRSMATMWPELWPELGPIVRRAYLGEASFFENLPITFERNGFPEQAWFMVSYSPLRDDSGALGGALCVCSETTQQVMEKYSLHRSESRWRGLFEDMQEGFFVAEAVRNEAGQMIDFRFIEVNPAFGAQSGLDCSSSIGHRARALIPGLQQSLIDTYAQVLSSGKPHDFEVHVAAMNRWFEARARRVSPQRFSVLFLEVTARVAADKALRASEARFRTLAQAIPDQMWTADADGMSNWFNDRVFDYSGMTFERLVGEGWGGIVHPHDWPSALRDWRAALASGQPFESHFRLRRADGVYRWFRARGLAVPNDSGVGKIWVGINTDVQDQHDANEALQRMNDTLELRVAKRSAELEAAHSALRQSQKLEAIGKLTGGVAHDFNNVLQVISGNLQLLRPFVGGDVVARARLNGAIGGVERGAKLSTQLLAFARKQPLEPVVINPGSLVVELGDMLRRTTGERVALETVIADGLWNTLIDPHQLENSLLNLVINARDAMDGEGWLRIEASNASLGQYDARRQVSATPGEYVMLAVSDSGAGMSEEVMQQACEPFFTTKPEGHGTGLGLSMVYGFVTQSGGHLQIDSAPGKGTTVRIYLPRSLTAPEAAAPPLARDVVGGSETILVVEDDAQVRSIVVALLADLGYRMLQAADAQEALALVESGVAVDLLFTDVVMPGALRSPELARRARRAQPAMEVLFTSGYAENGIVHGGRLERGVALLSKPYSREDLARKVRHALANRAHLPALAAPPRAPAEQRPGLAILLVEDNADMREMTADVLKALGHLVDSAGSGEEALEMLARSARPVLITDIGLPGMSGYQLAERARPLGVVAVLFASGYGAGQDLAPGSFWLQKPFTVERLQAALADIETWSRAAGAVS